MQFNLLRDRWIPIRAKSGKRKTIAPWELTVEYTDDPVLQIDFPRADLNSGMIQLLIGAVQTCLYPKSMFQWQRFKENPPDPEFLWQSMDKEADAFELAGKGPRFMQDLTLPREEKRNEVHVRGLFIDEPGNNTLRHNTDFFVKRGRVESICPSCAAAALYTLQANSPAGGQGTRTSLRGGGPLTTLILGRTLWETIWFNVLDRSQMESLPCDASQPREGGCYPWMAPTETSEGGNGTNPSQKHPLHVYWAMPRRIRLLFDHSEQGKCSVCGTETDIAVNRYWAKNLGYNYIGPWEHPLTPYSRQGQNEPYPMKGSPTGIRYRNWLGLIDRSQEGSTLQRIPARVVTVFRDHRAFSASESGAPDYRVWAFGYDMDNMKARSWVEGIVPVYEVSKELRPKYSAWIERYIQCADRVANNLRQAAKKGLFDTNREVKSDNSLLNALDLRFWSDTEQPFYRAMRELRNALEKGMDAPPVEDRRHWLNNILFRQAQAIFDEAVSSGEFKAEKHRRVALAWDQLNRHNSLRVRFFQDTMDLPQTAQQQA
mgnify:CR=1 FL=1